MSDSSSIVRTPTGTLSSSRGMAVDCSVRWVRGFAAYARGLAITLILGSLQAYKLLISPLLGSRCRFHPSCSEYAQTSVRRFGPVRGSWLALRRLARCGPWHEGGIDEVPNKPCECTDRHPNIQAAVNRTRA